MRTKGVTIETKVLDMALHKMTERFKSLNYEIYKSNVQEYLIRT